MQSCKQALGRVLIVAVSGTAMYSCNDMSRGRITREAPPEDQIMQIELFAERSKWTVRYPGEDNVLGADDYRLISDSNKLGINPADPAAADDFIAKEEIHLPAGAYVRFHLRSKDVIHAAWLPQMELHMNIVPGMKMRMELVADITTDSMRAMLNDPNFNYLLLCNKICGPEHYNMKKGIIIEKPGDFAAWRVNAKRNKVIDQL